MADFSEDYKDVLGSTARIVLASLVSYICAQSCDVYLFNKLRNNKVGKHKWIRNNVSTMTSQAVDTVMFITIAFFGTGANLLVMMASQFVVKRVIALLDTPIFYILTKGSEKQNPIE